MTILLLVLGFALLIKGADWLVDGASSLAAKLSISEIVIGLTIVSFGTSTPELVVNVLASIEGKPEITFGNIVGSNIVNILLILGIAGVICPISTQKNTVWKEIPFALMSSLVLWVLCNDMLLNSSKTNVISGGDGVILLMFFVMFLVYIFGIPKIEIDDTPEITTMSNLKILAYIVFGLIGLLVGGKLVVDSAVTLAQNLKVSDKLIGLTIVAVGTSLPELITSAVAAYKGKNDIAIGNVVGSNIFNVFFVMGVSATIAPIPLQSALSIDLLVLIFASVLLFFTMFTGKKRVLDRWEAVIFLILYVGYTAYLIQQSMGVIQ